MEGKVNLVGSDDCRPWSGGVSRVAGLSVNAHALSDRRSVRVRALFLVSIPVFDTVAAAATYVLDDPMGIFGLIGHEDDGR